MSRLPLSRRLAPVFGVFSLTLLVASALQYLPVYAAVPTVQNTLSIAKTGSEPFDATSWKSTQTTFPDGTAIDNGTAAPNTQAGRDASEDNDVARLGDSITYRVEVAVNDADVSEAISTVVLGDGLDVSQEWIAVPTGCKTDPAEVTTVSQLQDNNGDGVLETLLCNTGAEIEGTNRVIFPAARVLRLTSQSQTPVLNDDHVSATVSSQALGAEGVSAVAQAGPAYTNVTADFRVNLVKQIANISADAQGNVIYPTRVAATGPGGEAGTLVRYTIQARYEDGSMVALDTNGDGTSGYDLVDFYTDDNLNNNATTSASGTVLYDFGPGGAADACQLRGDHGAGASVSCATSTTTADLTGPAYTPDTVADTQINISLDGIDIADPNRDNNLFEFDLVLFVADTELTSHQSGDPYTNILINEVQGAGPAPFAPESQAYNAAGDTLQNYDGANEPGSSTGVSAGSMSDNNVIWPLGEDTPGGWSSRNTFWGEPYGGAFYTKTGDYAVATGETKTLEFFQSWRGGASQVGKVGISCAKLDYTNMEFAGVTRTPVSRPLTYDNRVVNVANPSVEVRAGGSPNVRVETGSTAILYYTDEPHATLTEQRDDTCVNDVNGDGKAVFDGVNLETNLADSPNDWTSDTATLPSGNASVTKIRFQTEYDQAYYESANPGADRAVYAAVVDLLIKPTAMGYGPDNYVTQYGNAILYQPNYSSVELFSSPESVDPDEVSFSFSVPYSDRLRLLNSSASLSKQTIPAGLKVVRGGDVVEFGLTTEFSGNWAGDETATLQDTLPSETPYIPGSERFSVDGGTSYVTHAQYLDNYQNNLAGYDVELTSPPNTSTGDLLTYEFADIATGEDLPLVTYKVQVDESLTSGSFVNTATLEAVNIAIDQNTVDTDDDGVPDAGDGVGDTLEQEYSLTIVPEAGFDVLKTVAPEVYATNQAFDYRLIYKNLGAEDYTRGDFIDVLPYNGDGAVGLGGFATGRTPATNYTGVYALQTIASGEGEQFLVTDAAPATIAIDPCASSNLPAGYVPADGDLCYQPYVNNGNLLPDGQATGTGITTWVACTSSNLITVDTDCPLDPLAITALRFQVPNIATTGGKSVTITLNPIGNRGGEVVYTTNPDGQQVVDYANSPNLGDIYTNSFSGRIKEISLEVISNDVTITPVTGTLGDTVWNDLDNDGVQNNAEPGLPGISVAILTAAGDPIYRDTTTGAIVYAANRATYETATGRILEAYTVTTDATGQYEFDQLPAGDYQVSLTPPSARVSQSYDLDDGATPVGTDVPATPFVTGVTLTPDINFVTGNILGVNSLDTVDFGLYDPADVAVDTTVDKDNDGSFVEFEVLDAPGLFGNPDPTIFQYRSTITNESTLTTATGVIARNYLPDGLEFVSYSEDGGPDQALPSPTADFDWNVADLAPGQTQEIIFTVRLTSANASAFIAGFDNGSSQFITEVVAMNEPDVDSQPDNKAASFEPASSEDDEDDARTTIRPALGDFVWSDTNNNGLQDAGEPGLGGVTVNLYVDDGDGTRQPGAEDGAPIATVQTLPDGSYYFGGLTDGTPYYIEFDHSTAPDNHRPVPATTGTDTALDSNGDPDTGLTEIVTLTPGELNDTLDMGYYPLLSLGNLVFEDRNNNGLFEPTDTPLAGVTVQLYEDTDGDGQYTPGVDLQSLEPGSNGGPGFAVTDTSGNYLFETLTPGDYLVLIPENQFADSAALAGYVPSTGTNASATGPYESAPDPADGVDNDDNGTLQSEGYATTTVTLVDASDLTLDLGLFQPASLGSTVWLDTDADGQDNAEPGVPGVTLTLYDSRTGSPVATAVTDDNGEYLFDYLVPGDYYLELTDIPAGYDLTLLNQGDDATDSDFDPATRRTAVIALGYGQELTTVYSGLVPLATPVDDPTTDDEPVSAGPDTLLRTGGEAITSSFPYVLIITGLILIGGILSGQLKRRV